MRLIRYLLVSILFITFSCSSSHQKAPKRKILSMSFSHFPITVDPRNTGDFISSTLEFMYLQGLTKMDAHSTTSPGLAEKIEISPDGLTYYFHLRNAVWSDGTPIEAKHFVNSWRASIDPKHPSPSAHLFYPIKNASAIAKGLIPPEELAAVAETERLLVVTLEHPCPYFLELTSFCTLFPAPPSHEKSPDVLLTENPKEILSSGPFKIASYSKEKIVLEKNHLYWDKGHVYLDEVHIYLVESSSKALKMYEQNDLSITQIAFSEMPKETLSDFMLTNEVFAQPISATTSCKFNTKLFPFSNKNIRKAFGIAINRKEIIENVSLLDNLIATSIIPPILVNKLYDEKRELEPVNDEELVEQARQLLEEGLKELGLKKSSLNGITYTYSNSALGKHLAQAIQHQIFRALGINLTLEECSFKNYLDKLKRGDYQVLQIQWIAQFNDPISILGRFKNRSEPGNYTFWENRAFEELIDASNHCLDPLKRLEILKVAEEIFMDDLPETPLYHWSYAYLKKPNIQGLYISPIGFVHLDHVIIENEGK